MTESNPLAAITAAFRQCDSVAVRSVLRRHPELTSAINEPRFDFDAPAIVAFANHAPMVEVLLEFGADPNQRSAWWAGGFHPLHIAEGDAAEALLAAGSIPDACGLAHLDRAPALAAMIAARPACVHERGGDGQTPLHFAKSREVVDLLLAHGADIDARDVDHRSTAAEWMLSPSPGRGRTLLSRYLVERGASADIFLCAAHGLTTRARTILAADPTALSLRTGAGAYGEQPPSSHHIYFWSLGADVTPVRVAAAFGHHDTREAMLAFASPAQRLVDLCLRGEADEARAMVAADSRLIASLGADDHRALADAAWRRDEHAVALLLDLGFDPAAAGVDSGTALHCAAWQGAVRIVEVLLRHPSAASLIASRESRHGGTPLGWCCHGSLFGDRAQDHAGVAVRLLAAGAVPGPHDSEAAPAVARVIESHVRGSSP